MGGIASKSYLRYLEVGQSEGIQPQHPNTESERTEASDCLS